MVYKVCEFKGVPRMKISEETEKTTIPGSKKVLRAYDKDDKPLFDALCLQDEQVQAGTFVDRVTGEKHQADKVEEISTLMFANGKATSAHLPFK